MRLRDSMNHILHLLAGLSFLLMVIFTCWQVFTRYILRNPSPWSEELVSYLFAWMSLFAAALVTGERGHMNIPVVLEKTREPARTYLAVLNEGIAGVFSLVILVYGGIQITNLAMGQMTAALGIAVGVFYLVLPVSGGLSLVYTVLNIRNLLQGREG